MDSPERLHADAEDAVIRAEMARSGLDRARESLDDRQVALQRSRAKAQARRDRETAVPEPEPGT